MFRNDTNDAEYENDWNLHHTRTTIESFVTTKTNYWFPTVVQYIYVNVHIYNYVYIIYIYIFIYIYISRYTLHYWPIVKEIRRGL